MAFTQFKNGDYIVTSGGNIYLAIDGKGHIGRRVTLISISKPMKRTGGMDGAP